LDPQINKPAFSPEPNKHNIQTGAVRVVPFFPQGAANGLGFSDAEFRKQDFS
jgi:hypothetical protein